MKTTDRYYGFIFYRPYKVRKSEISVNYINSPKDCYYQRTVSIYTPNGIVVADDMKWQTNTGIDSFTFFTIIMNGKIYSGSIDIGKLTDKQIKTYSKRFVDELMIYNKKLNR